MSGALRRFWFEFELPDVPSPRPAVLLDGSRAHMLFGRGCGVTAWDEPDGLALIERTLGADLGDETMPRIRRVRADVDVGDLPEDIRRSAGVPSVRGVWFPPSSGPGTLPAFPPA